jgi:hypothetical protein
MMCVKCQREIAAERARAAIILGDGRAALDWQCFESMLKPGRAMELMRLLREATARSRAVAEKREIAGGEKLQDEAK